MWSGWPNILILVCILQTSMQTNIDHQVSGDNLLHEAEDIGDDWLDLDQSAISSFGLEDDDVNPESSESESRFESKQKKTYPLTVNFLRFIIIQIIPFLFTWILKNLCIH